MGYDFRKVDSGLGDIVAEYLKAVNKFPPFNSYYEGYAVLKEEVDELWEAVKKKDPDPEKLRKEAVQVGAMALRFLVDLC